MLMELLWSLSGQVESRQVVSGTEEGPRRPEKSQLLKSTRTRGRGRLGALLQQHTSHRQINLFQTQAFCLSIVFGSIVWLQCIYMKGNSNPVVLKLNNIENNSHKCQGAQCSVIGHQARKDWSSYSEV